MMTDGKELHLRSGHIGLCWPDGPYLLQLGCKDSWEVAMRHLLSDCADVLCIFCLIAVACVGLAAFAGWYL